MLSDQYGNTQGFCAYPRSYRGSPVRVEPIEPSHSDLYLFEAAACNDDIQYAYVLYIPLRFESGEYSPMQHLGFTSTYSNVFSRTNADRVQPSTKSHSWPVSGNHALVEGAPLEIVSSGVGEGHLYPSVKVIRQSEGKVNTHCAGDTEQHTCV